MNGILALIFDTIRWPFPIKTLEALNFGTSFIRWIKFLYTDPMSCVTNNGHSSKFFKLGRGIRQGCCISALIFILVAEILAINIRNNTDIKGIVINNVEYKINQLADDTSLFITDVYSLRKALGLLDKFALISELKVNKDKTEIIMLGNKLANIDTHGLTITRKPFKLLGVWFSKDKQEMLSKNLEEKYENMVKILNIWFSRNLSVDGKIVVLKSLVLSLILNTISVVYVPQHVINKIDKLFFDFLWGKGKVMVKRSTIIAKVEVGGLNMLDFHSMVSAIKIMWVKRILGNCNVKWNNLSMVMSGIQESDLTNKLKVCFLIKHSSQFYSQILDFWYNFYSVEPQNYREILSEQIWKNHFIQINSRPISKDYVSWRNAGILHINDLLNGNLFLSKNELSLKYNLNISDMEYNCLISAIPKKWKKVIARRLHLEAIIIKESTLINALNKDVKLITNKEVYQCLVEQHITRPTSENKWIETFPFLESLNWETVYSIPKKCITETRLKSFQYSVFHRFLN